MADLYIVHCIDTEGPLYESLIATFERIEALTGVKIEPTAENLEKIQQGELCLSGYEELAKIVFSKRILDYNSDWSKMDEMLDNVTSPETRMKYADSYGKPWIFNWFVLDHAEYVSNPRRRDIGYNNVWNHYMEYYRQHKINEKDEFYWHAHPASILREANRAGTSYINSPTIFSSLAHRIIDCFSFPICFRPGMHTERPDSHWFLEQFIPFDFSNQSVLDSTMDDQQNDISDGRFGDWRRARNDWKPYHPSHDDYQTEGDCRRVIFRCLNVGTRLRVISQKDVDMAFAEVCRGNDTVIAFSDHDFRNFMPDMEEVYEMLGKAAQKYPSVKWRNSSAKDAAISVLKIKKTPICMSTNMDGNKLTVETNIESFGPQPFLAISTKDGRYFMENFDFQVPRRKWTYTFDNDSVRLEFVDKIGIATNSMHGTGCLKVLEPNGSVLKEREW